VLFVTTSPLPLNGLLDPNIMSFWQAHKVCISLCFAQLLLIHWLGRQSTYMYNTPLLLNGVAAITPSEHQHQRSKHLFLSPPPLWVSLPSSGKIFCLFWTFSINTSVQSVRQSAFFIPLTHVNHEQYISCEISLMIKIISIDVCNSNCNPKDHPLYSKFFLGIYLIISK